MQREEATLVGRDNTIDLKNQRWLKRWTRPPQAIEDDDQMTMTRMTCSSHWKQGQLAIDLDCAVDPAFCMGHLDRHGKETACCRSPNQRSAKVGLVWRNKDMRRTDRWRVSPWRQRESSAAMVRAQKDKGTVK
jgi:hypothetical protein